MTKSRQAHSTKQRSRLKTIAPVLGLLAVSGAGLYGWDALLRGTSEEGYGLRTRVLNVTRSAFDKNSRSKVLEALLKHSQYINKARANKKQRAQLVKKEISRWPLDNMTANNKSVLENKLKRLLEPDPRQIKKNDRGLYISAEGGIIGERAHDRAVAEYERHLKAIRDLNSKYPRLAHLKF